jgi:glycosyltransferase involved in cell wall biosynthesis
MCTYNGELYLREQLDSIANQTMLPSELVICDDGSVDSTQEIVADFARSAPFKVEFVRNSTNLGSTKNFEQAIELCCGELIALCDQDDIWMDCKLARLAVEFADSSIGGVFSNGTLIGDNSQDLGATLWEVFGFTPRLRRQWQAKGALPIFLKQDIVTGATLIFRADQKLSFIPISREWIHDGWIAWIIALTSRLKFVNIPLIRYRVHTSQQAGVPNMTIRARLARIPKDESSECLHEAKKFEELLTRLDIVARTQPSLYVESLGRKSRHCRFRAQLPKSRAARLPVVLLHLPDYAQYSRGLRDAIKDVLH